MWIILVSSLNWVIFKHRFKRTLKKLVCPFKICSTSHCVKHKLSFTLIGLSEAMLMCHLDILGLFNFFNSNSCWLSKRLTNFPMVPEDLPFLDLFLHSWWHTFIIPPSDFLRLELPNSHILHLWPSLNIPSINVYRLISTPVTKQSTLVKMNMEHKQFNL